MKDKHDTRRRDFLALLARGAAAAAVGGVVWGHAVESGSRAPLVLRPPGALAEPDFLGKCIRCGLCVGACPYDTLSLAVPGAAAPVGTPSMTPREIPCYLCQDIPCAVECPTGALDLSALTKDDGTGLDVNRTRIGLAVVDRENCIAFWGLRCDACYRTCPLIDKAITIEHSRNERTGRHAMLAPRVHAEHCTGCGLCERACVVEKAAIFVLPHDVAQGAVGNDYIRGWESGDENRLDSPAPPAEQDDPSGGALDYLNDGELDGG
ncbi:MAG: ferredoxin-type protein NapG [bacterium]|nr:ferredoxin-type protein NapG [bacterium]